MTGKGKNITPEFRVENKLFFPDTYVEKESARAIAKRYAKSDCYSEKDVNFFNVSKKGNRLIITDDQKRMVFPKESCKINDGSLICKSEQERYGSLLREPTKVIKIKNTKCEKIIRGDDVIIRPQNDKRDFYDQVSVSIDKQGEKGYSLQRMGGKKGFENNPEGSYWGYDSEKGPKHLSKQEAIREGMKWMKSEGEC